MSGRTFITDDFLLQSNAAKKLYHDYAKDLPIIDYHNHLSPADVANNRKFENITKVWLEGDHYKWRAMRALGINEKYITGKASDQEKFEKWAEVVKFTVRNPLYHWTHLELVRYFGVDSLLTSNNAESVYRDTTAQLQEESHHTMGLLDQQGVELICTTDDPTDDLENHRAFAAQGTSLTMTMTFRPDKAYGVENTQNYLSYLEKLEEVTGTNISRFGDLLAALDQRIHYFHENGCRLSDHGLGYLPYVESGSYDIDGIFKKLKDGKSLDNHEVDFFKCEVLKHLCKSYHKKGWVQQFHLGALRNVNSRLFQAIGADAGVDTMGDFPQALTLAKFLDHLDRSDQLPKTILYNLNPANNDVFATMAGTFQDGSVKGKVQYGSSWWFLDQKDGIEKQLDALSNMGILSTFIGMLTDSRSFLSFPRHEYFRRVLCNLLGNEMEKGLMPNDPKYIGEIVGNICYHNAAQFFPFQKNPSEAQTVTNRNSLQDG